MENKNRPSLENLVASGDLALEILPLRLILVGVDAEFHRSSLSAAHRLNSHIP